MKTVLYARVSTVDQTIEHQLEQALRAGFKIDQVVADHGQSGITSKLSDRPEGRRLKDILRAGDVLVVRWVDRLGRNYHDVTETIRSLIKDGVIVKTVINQLVFDGATKDPIQQAIRDAMIAFMAATAESQAEATKEAQKAGIAHAKNLGTDKYRGRKPQFTREQFDRVLELSGTYTDTEIWRMTGVKRPTVARIRANPKEHSAMLANWGI